MNDKRDISPTAQTLRRLAAERILVLDGAMGTMIPVSYTHLTLPTILRV